MTWRSIKDDPPPKDGTYVIWAGQFKPYDILPGGGWARQIFHWSTIMSDGTGFDWISPELSTPDNWHVDWTHWMPLPEPPA